MDGLGVTSPPSTIEVTVMPQPGGGAIVAAYHARWATEALRTRAWSNVLSLSGGVLFIAFGLMLILGRLVTAPVGRLAGEVRHLGEGNLGAPLSDQDSPELQQLASDISALRDDLLRAVRESSTDPLTGVANHRAFHERLEAAVAHTGASGEPLGLIAIDLDKLKSVNDRWGHAAGDRLIQAVAARLTECCREQDLCARIGGDEFAVLCPGSSREAVDATAARMVEAVRSLSSDSLLGVGGVELSISAGVGDMPRSSSTKDQLVRQADTALYRMKWRDGRPEPPPREPQATPPPPPAAALDSEATVRALAVAVDAKDSGTRSHSETVARYAVAIGRRLGFDDADVDALRRAALLHDVGKIGTPDAILHKPGSLTDEEYAAMKSHSTLGYRILLNGGLPTCESLWVLHHHEHLDGSGYPHGLRGDEIPLQSRIMLVADAFEAMTCDRPYRQARPAGEAIAELRRCAGRQFDPAVVEAFVATLTDGGTAEEPLPSPIFDRMLTSESEAAS
jgi:diguanylate cyclase (GGDEF)-like protein/putative nucleotidyltransferase with HDIG domain